MKTIRDIISEISEVEARAAVYYASRYIKQAALLLESGKDVFSEDRRSAPSESIQAATLAIIAAIETKEKCAAEKFSDEQWKKWIDVLLKIEHSLECTDSDAARRNALAFVRTLRLPTVMQVAQPSGRAYGSPAAGSAR